MSDISKIKVSGVEYDVKDNQAREDLDGIDKRVTALEEGGGGTADLSGVIACLTDIKSLLNRAAYDAEFDFGTVLAQLQQHINALDPDAPEYEVSFAEGVLTITKAPAVQSDSVLSIS